MIEVHNAYISAIADIKEKLQQLNDNYPCRESSMSITKLEEAILWQAKRIADLVKEQKNKEEDEEDPTQLDS